MYMTNAICIICYKPPNKALFEFYNSFKNYEVYIILDDNSKDYKNSLELLYTNISIIQMDKNICIDEGFQYAADVGKKTTKGFGWEKAIYSFAKTYTHYENVWIMEEDVFIYGEETLINLDVKYKEEDLLCNSSFGEGKLHEWVWRMLTIKLDPPYYCGMVCGIRVSQKLLTNVKEYANAYKMLFFIEALFPTLSKKNGFKIIESPPEFSNVTFNNTFDIKSYNKTNLFHPCKNVEQWTSIRQFIDNKHISILMPIYNGIEFIGESVPTILYQTYKDWELIIGINGHPKDSDVYKEAKKWEEKDSRIKVVDLYTIKGKSEALNEMLKICKYAWVSLLDVDDKWLPKKLESQTPYMEKYDVIGTQCKYFGDLHLSPLIPHGDITHHNFFQYNPIINSSSLIRKELCYWDGSLNLEDYDLWLKLWKQGKKFYNVNEIQVLHRIHNDSAFNAKGNNLKVNDLKQKYL